MTSRRILLGTAGVLALPRLARAQALPRLGVVMGSSETDADAGPRRAALLQGLEAAGWKDGETLRITWLWGSGRPELIQRHVREIVAAAPDVILANGTPVVTALHPLTRSIPIVCALVTDPVGLGLVESLAKPGGNITGFTFISPELIAKWLGLLKEVAPGLRRAAVLYNPAVNAWYPRVLAEIARSPQPAPLPVVETIIRAGEEIAPRIEALAQEPGTGLMIGPESFILGRLREVVALALAHRMPGVSVYRQFAVEGGLMSYGPDVPDIFRRAAGYVDRILRGASPASLPVQQPVAFEFVLNHGTANRLGLGVSQTLLAAADTVID